MDVVRGVAVLLVVVLHSAYVPVARGDLTLPGWTGAFNDALSPFRIPVLVVLSGLLLGPSLDKGWQRFFSGKLRRIGWPYLLWTAVSVALAGYLSAGLVLSHLRGGTYLWYLLFLLVYYLAAWLLRPVPTSAVVAAALLLAVLAPDGSKYGERLVLLFALFMLGHLVASTPRVWRWVTCSPWAPALGVVLLVAHLTVGPRGDGYGPGTLPGTLGGLLVAIPLARWAAGSVLSRPLRFVGRESLVYYVVHLPVMVVGTLALVRAGVDDGLVVAAVVLPLAVASATVLALLGRRAPVRWLFTAPGRRSVAART